VPVAIGDVRLTFAGAIEIPGKVAYVHPLHNLAVVSYDPRLIGDTPVQSARLDTTPLKPGDKVWAIGLRADQKVASQATEVASIDAAGFPLSRTLQFRDSNLETISLVNPPTDYDGVLADKSGRVLALWSSFAFQEGRDTDQANLGVSAELVEELLSLAASGRALHSLEAEFQELPISSARKVGLAEEWIGRLEAHNPDRRQLLAVGRLVAGSPAARVLQTGDLLLAIDGGIANRFREVERAVQKHEVMLTVWRNGSVMDVTVQTVPLYGRDIDRVLIWAGATLQAPHRALPAQRGIPPEGVFVAYFYYGSPATRYQLYAGRRITEVDGRPTPDLDAFVDAVAGKPHLASVRLKTVTWNNAVEVITLKLDKHYWPAYELRRTGSGWQRIEQQ
jgi:S1-C subfamily serine protease